MLKTLIQRSVKIYSRYPASKLLLLSITSLAIAGFFSFYQPNTKPLSQKAVSVATITTSPSPVETPKTDKVITAHKITKVQPQTTPLPTTNIVVTSTANLSKAATPTPISQPTSQPTQAPSNIVNLQIVEPDGNFNFSVALKNGNNLCDNLTEAKNEGKIRSLTLDDSYMSSYHSSYVREINGYQNNWTVNVNGTVPQGCSLYSPKSGDTVTWKFG